MNTIIEFLICTVQIIGHLLVFLLGIGGFGLGICGFFIGFFGPATGMSNRDSVSIVVISTILGSILMLGSLGLKLLLQ
jgi:hypothetical protein